MQLFTGARVSEVAGITWLALNFDECSVEIKQNYMTIKKFEYDEETHTITSLGRSREITDLKSKSSYRTLGLPKEYMEVLKLHKYLQMETAKKNHKQFRDSDFIFTTSTYTPVGRNDINDKVKKVVKDLNIENWDEITSHCLRHRILLSCSKK